MALTTNKEKDNFLMCIDTAMPMRALFSNGAQFIEGRAFNQANTSFLNIVAKRPHLCRFYTPQV